MKSLSTRKRWMALCAGASVILLLSAGYTPETGKKKYHSEGEMVKLLSNGPLPIGSNSVFLGSGKCAGCHGIDSADPPIANITDEGENVSPAENWRGTMMANSARDPLWRAKVAHEVSVNPDHQEELETTCTSCHAPMGRYAALHDGQETYSIAEMVEDSLALDGVSCGACHQQRMESVGDHFSGELYFHTDTIWGPYVSEELDFPLFAAAMTSFVGYEPVGSHMFAKSETCAGCHSLITHTVDLDGVPTGGTFIEQATYHEWLNSEYNLSGLHEGECQGCHMPRLQDSIVIASGYSFLPGRSPYGQHWFVGGNTFMLNLLKNNIETLGLTASEDHFNTVIARTFDNLQNHTAEVEIIPGEVDGDTARYTVKLTNLAGHKFPSGYPARKAWIEFVMTDADGNEIFHSGATDNQYYVVGESLSEIEPHYDLITSDDQVQIYEMVMGDVNGNITTVLERAATPLKDNRLVPLGFTTSHPAYDSTQVVGPAAQDPNFNHINGVEGSGTDEVRFHIPVAGVDGAVTVTARLIYQTVPPKWTQELFAVDHPTINQFEEMYWGEGAEPVIVGTDQVSSTLVNVRERGNNGLLIGPNPTADGWINVSSSKYTIREVIIYDATGKLVERRGIYGGRASIVLPLARGNYFIEVVTDKGSFVEKVLRR